MKFRALRSVCVGVGDVFALTDEPRELDRATANFLLSIHAVEEVSEPAPPAADEPKQDSTPAKSGRKEK